MILWPEEARIAALGAFEGFDVNLTATQWMKLAGRILNAASPLVCAAERERVAGRLDRHADVSSRAEADACKLVARLIRDGLLDPPGPDPEAGT